MTTLLKSLGLDKLSRDERIALAQELWDSIVAEQGPSLLTEAQRMELLRRADEADADPDGGIPWEEVKAKARARFKS
jgi:putative addiction module component (TIGR02574 family)